MGKKLKIAILALIALIISCCFVHTSIKGIGEKHNTDKSKQSIKIADLDGDGIANDDDNDIDGDGLSNDKEEAINSDPFNKDTDGDGKLDGEEYHKDTDKDGKIDKVEKGKDSDGDGKSDVVESAKLDADSDGVVDELDAKDDNPNNDTDNDGISNIEEVKAGTNPLDPNSKIEPDTDKDGKLDKIEKGKDTDGDGKSDLIESAKLDADNDGVVDELDANDSDVNNDSDGDGVSNIDEKNAGTNPLDPNDKPAVKKDEPQTNTQDINITKGKVDEKVKEDIESQIKDILHLHKIEFETNKATLTAKGKEIVDRVAAILNKYPAVKIKIEGYTDSDGKAEYNLKLSQDRVDTVKAELVKSGISAERLKAIGYGETKPFVPNDSAENKARNRRVGFKAIIGE